MYEGAQCKLLYRNSHSGTDVTLEWSAHPQGSGRGSEFQDGRYVNMKGVGSCRSGRGKGCGDGCRSGRESGHQDGRYVNMKGVGSGRSGGGNGYRDGCGSGDSLNFRAGGMST